MKTLTFPGGVHPLYYKEISLIEPLREAPLSDVFVVPLSQHAGKPNEALVKKGDRVEEGQLIGSSDAFISSPVHSPVSGVVKEIKKTPHPVLGLGISVIIERDREKQPKSYPTSSPGDITLDTLVKRVRESGIVGLGGAAFPTHVKLSVPEGKHLENLIINGAECEPFLTCDQTLMSNKPAEILRGIGLVASVLRPEKIYLAVEDNKKSVFFVLKKIIEVSEDKTINRIKPVLFRTKYPQGGERQLIKAVTGREIPPGKLPIDVGSLVHNVGTIYAIYEAVYRNKPLIERVVTISGDCLKKSANFIVKIGTTIKDVIERFGVGIVKDPKKIIVGGPMMGFSQSDAETPIIKSTSGVLFMSSSNVVDYEEKDCIKCAKCVDSCPLNLSPTEIMRNVKAMRMGAMEGLWAADCIECGACAYECPARVPLVQYIKQGKLFLLEKSRK